MIYQSPLQQGFQIQLIRFRRYVNQNGNKHKKMDSIDSFVFSLFENVRTKSIVIHDTDQ